MKLNLITAIIRFGGGGAMGCSRGVFVNMLTQQLDELGELILEVVCLSSGLSSCVTQGVCALRSGFWGLC